MDSITLLGILWMLLGYGVFCGAGCGCDNCPCTPGTSFQIDVAGVANGTSGSSICTHCANLNGTYFLTPDTVQCGGTAAAGCFWKYSNLTMTDACGDYGFSCNGICVQLFQNKAADTVTVLVMGRAPPAGGGPCTFLGSATVQPFATFIKSFGGATSDCSVYNPLSVPFSSSANGVFRCNWTAATVNATAI